MTRAGAGGSWLGARARRRLRDVLDSGPAPSRSSRPRALPALHPTMTDEPILRALTALRDASDRSAPELMAPWRTVKGVLEEHARRTPGGVPADREDAVNEALIDVVRGLDAAKLRDEAGARSWLRRIFTNAFLDLVRSKQRRREVFDEAPLDAFERELAERQHADDERTADVRRHPDELAAYERMLFDRVDEHVEAHVRSHARANARRRAEVAYERIVRERSYEALERMTGGAVQRATLYKHAQRGRDDILLPVARRWAGEVGHRDDERGFVEQLIDLLEASVQGDEEEAS